MNINDFSKLLIDRVKSYGFDLIDADNYLYQISINGLHNNIYEAVIEIVSVGHVRADFRLLSPPHVRINPRHNGKVMKHFKQFCQRVHEAVSVSAPGWLLKSTPRPNFKPSDDIDNFFGGGHCDA